MDNNLSVNASQISPAPDDKSRGLYLKYYVERVKDPERKHAACFFFVLDLDHDPFALPALETYAENCEAEYPQLAADLREHVKTYRYVQSLSGAAAIPTDETGLEYLPGVR